MTVTIYSKPNCPQCERTRLEFDRLGVAYEVVDLVHNPGQLDRLISAGYRSAPVVETDAGTWSGYAADRIRRLAAMP